MANTNCQCGLAAKNAQDAKKTVMRVLSSFMYAFAAHFPFKISNLRLTMSRRFGIIESF